MTISRDDIRAAVGAGTITEAQAASILALSDARRGYRENIEGLDEPFELFKGFNEIFIVVGLCILYGGWLGLMGVALFGFGGPPSFFLLLTGVITLGVTCALTFYFTLQRRMIAPSILLSLIFASGAVQVGVTLASFFFDVKFQIEGLALALTGGVAFVLLLVFWRVFHIPFTMLLIGVSVFATGFGITTNSGARLDSPQDLFLLSADGPFSILTIVLGLIGLAVALRFDMSDPHRVTRRSANGFWLHVISAPAIVNTVALTLFNTGSNTALFTLFVFLILMAMFAIVIDRRSFLVSGVGYVVALAFTVIQDQQFVAILLLGAALVLLGAQWERLRGALMRTLPAFPGKSNLPPWGLLKETHD